MSGYVIRSRDICVCTWYVCMGVWGFGSVHMGVWRFGSIAMNFGDTSPFYLKLSMGAMHTLGGIIVASVAWQMAQESEVAMIQCQRSSAPVVGIAPGTPRAVNPRTVNPRTVMHDPLGIAQSSDEFWRVLMGGERIRQVDVHAESGEKDSGDNEDETCVATAATTLHPQPSSHLAWATRLSGGTQLRWWWGGMGDKLHGSMGVIFFSSVPIMVAMLACVMSIIPGVVKQGVGSTSMHALVSVIGYCVCCIHAGVSVPTRLFGTVSPRKDLPTMVFSLHAACHILYQSIRGIAMMKRSKRRVTSGHLQMASLIMWFCLLLLHILATGMHTRQWAAVYTHQDVMLVHAIAAFLPEVLGTVYIWSRIAVSSALSIV